MAVLAMGVLSVMMFITGGVVDYASLEMQRRHLQEAADAAALSSAHELVVSEGSATRVQAVVQSYIGANYEGEATASAQLLEKGTVVSVTVSAPPRVYFMGPVAQSAGPVTVTAVAEVVGGSANVCVIALDDKKAGALSLDSNAELIAPNCAIYANSTHKDAVISQSNAKLSGALICSGGGSKGGTGNFSPQPITDCPSLGDPLAGRPPPPVGACTYNKMEKDDFVGALSPGVYCGGLKIKGNSRITLDPGVYIIKDGEFLVDSNSEVQGEYVGFYFTGSAAVFRFTSNAVIDLSAPKDGPLAGLLFFEDPASVKDKKYIITSNFADRLVGTIYIPRGNFTIDANNDVAGASEFTVVVVNTLELKAGPQLVLNTDYGLIDVPVPEGVGPNSKKSGVKLTY